MVLLLKNFKRIVIFLVIFLVPTYATKYSWSGERVYSEQLGKTINIYLQIFEDESKGLNVGIVRIDVDGECLRFEKTTAPAASVLINGTKVQMLYRCVNKGLYMMFPKTKKGREYLMKELRTKEIIKFQFLDTAGNVGSYFFSFSTKGFSKVYSTSESRISGL